MPSSAALAAAPSFILTKKGLVSVFVIRQAETSAAWAGAANTTPSASAPRAAETIVFFMKSSQGLKNGTGEPARQASPTATSPLPRVALPDIKQTSKPNPVNK